MSNNPIYIANIVFFSRNTVKTIMEKNGMSFNEIEEAKYCT